jgi:hypothetical protein
MEMTDCNLIINKIKQSMDDIKKMNETTFDDGEYIDIDKKINEVQKIIDKNSSIDLERKTLVLISKEKNKNIEIYYLIYLLFSVLFIIIQICIIFLYN